MKTKTVDGLTIRKEGKEWVVVHNGSDLRLVANGFRTKWMAQLFSERVADLAPWHKPADVVCDVPKLRTHCIQAGDVVRDMKSRPAG